MAELIIAVSVGATAFWRILGAHLSKRLSADSMMFRYFSCVAYALLAALLVQMTLHPQSSLADSEGWQRLTALAVTLAAYKLSRSNIAIGTLAGTLTFALLLNL